METFLQHGSSNEGVRATVPGLEDGGRESLQMQVVAKVLK